ncbi:MAG TPA: SdrD B-like domain-containing protein [Longimicrobium sp.]
MSFTGTLTRMVARDPSRTRWVRRALAAAWVAGLATVGAPRAATAQAGDTVLVVNRVSATFGTQDGFVGTAEATATVVVKITAGVRITAPQSAALVPGERRVFAHRLENVGNGADRYTLAASGPSGWTIRLYLDTDGNGVLGAGDLLVSGPVPLGARESAALLLVVEVPSNAPDMGSTAIDVKATSTADPTVTDSVRDTVTVRRPLAALSLGKSVDRSDATPGDTLRYTLTYANAGDAASGAAEVTDTLASVLSAVPGSLTLNGAPLTDAADGDAGSVERIAGGRQLVRVRVGAIAAGAAGGISFRAVVGAEAGSEPVRNSATMNVERLPDTPPMGANSPVVETQLVRAQLALAKELAGSDTVRVGQTAEFRLTWTNSSAVTAHQVVLEDTLPAGLEFIRAERGAEVAGRVVRWSLGSLRPGETGSAVLTVRVVARPQDAAIVNRATLRAANASPVTAEAGGLKALGFNGDELVVTKTAGVLEAAMGEAIPFTVAVQNKASVALRNVEVIDILPAGLRYVEGRLTGADSARVEGNTVRFWIGELPALATRTVSYVATVVSPGDARALQNRATATAEGGTLRSDTASAWVRMRGGFAVQVRTLVGKVWMDANDNGRQEAGERGVAGVDVWSADGEVVTTDREGRFSFRDVRVGTHALRVDTVGVPAGFGFARPQDAVVRVRMEGWTTPRVDFRLVPRGGAATVTVTGPNAPAERTVGGGPAAPVAPSADAPVKKDSLPAAPRVAPARTEEARQADAASSFATGPAVRFFAPADGAVIATNRVFVGVRGEPGATVRLFDGDSAIAEATLRPDGVADFIGVQVGAGPHRLRVEMKNSWGQQRADSLALHVSGEAGRFEVDGTVAALHAGAPRADTVRVRVLDTWGVPLAGGIAVTVEGSGAEPLGADREPASPGQQLRADSAGMLFVPVRPGHIVGPGELRLSSGKAAGRIPLRVLPSTRPLIATGVGQIGVGAAPDAFGAVTVRGSVGRETTVSVSYDSRRGSQADDFFARGYDPNDESRYPTFGDGSERRVLSSSTQKVSARVERGYDWVAMGDVETGDFGGDPRLGTYGRSLTGVTGRVATGAVTWRGFGSMTDQVLAQRQVRGNGTSGPYRFGNSVRPGTDRVAVEVRARENAARVISRQELVRWSDYQIDYATGEVLLQHPVPTNDLAGNPVFVVAMLESRSGGEARFVGGVRMEVDAARILRMGATGDSLAFSVMGVRDGGEPTSGFGGQDLLGTGVRLRRGSLSLRGEMLRSQRPDSSAFAGRAEASVSLFKDRARIGAEWLKVGAGFAPGTDPRLSAGVQEIRAIGELRLSPANSFSITHDRQRFDGFGMERASTMLRSRNVVAGRPLVTEAGMTSDNDGSGTAASALGKMTLSVTPRADVWLEGAHVLSDRRPVLGSTTLPSRPDQMGLGASYRVFGSTRIEGTHRWVTTHGDSAGSYGLSSVNVRTGAILGGQMWGGLERADTERASHSAVLGWNQRLSLNGGWALNVLAERHFGLNRASLLDPTRALPFAQTERDRWSTGAGVEYLPTDSALRFSARAELHGGAEAQGYRIDVAGDLPIGSSAALLTRHDWWQDNRNVGNGMQLARRDRSLLGLAMRPAQHNDLNVLAKLEWRNTVNPLLAGSVGSSALSERRLIGATDALWAVRKGTEIGARYAVRWASRQDSSSGLGAVSNLAHFGGARLQQEIRGPLSMRMDGRVLLDATGRASRWNLAPALVAALGPRVEVEGGYRFGNLIDPDFAQQGGRGFYATLGVRFTESALTSAADFWRERIARDR